MGVNQTKQLNNHIAKGVALHTSDLETAFQSTVSQANPLESMNINVGYLLSLIRLIDEFTIVEIRKNDYNSETDYLYHLWRLTRSMRRLLKCKMSEEKSKEFRRRELEAQNMIGEVTTGADNEYVDNQKAFETESYIGEIFEDLVADMEQRGMLTYKKEDPMNAMGKFSD